MVQNGTFVPTVLMQGEIELVVSLKYIIMRIFNDIICMTALPWQHQFKIFCVCHLQKCIDKVDAQSVCQLETFASYNLSRKKVERLLETH